MRLMSFAIDFAHRLGVRRTYLTHLTHKIGRYTEASKRLHEGVSFAYDGLQIDV